MGEDNSRKRRKSGILSLIFLLALPLTVHSVALSQPDSVVVPREFRFAPSVRGGFLEASSLLLILGTFGASADFDLMQVPSPTIQQVGVRLTFQELTSGFLWPNGSNVNVGYVRGAFLRGTQKQGSSRFDIMMGVASFKPDASQPNLTFLAIVDIHWMIFQPYCTFFMRIAANPRGAVPLFGLALGYIN